jgi:hypothetical protein
MNLDLYCQNNKNLYNQETQMRKDHYGYVWEEKVIVKEPKETLEKVSLEEYKEKIIRDKSPKLLVINSNFNGKIFPIIDIDEHKELENIEKQINSFLEDSYTIIESSIKKYWIIINKGFDNFDSAYNYVDIISNGDIIYKRLSNKRKSYFLRAEYKNEFLIEPNIIKETDNNFEFPKLIVDFYIKNKKSLKQIYDLKGFSVSEKTIIGRSKNQEIII